MTCGTTDNWQIILGLLEKLSPDELARLNDNIELIEGIAKNQHVVHRIDEGKIRQNKKITLARLMGMVRDTYPKFKESTIVDITARIAEKHGHFEHTEEYSDEMLFALIETDAKFRRKSPFY